MSATTAADELARELRSFAEQLATDAGRVALAARRQGAVDGDTKSSDTDLVTAFDRAAERSIVDAIRARWPDDAIIGEEGAAFSGTSGRSWYVDPIDGTTNFVYDQPAWSCSVAVGDGAGMIAGAVYVPPLDELYSAHAGGGATCNARPIHTSDLDDVSTALVGTGFGYDRSVRRDQARIVTRLIGEVRDIRRLGSAAFDLCCVAAGRLDAYFERHLNSWDAAAGELIAREAGAVSSDGAGRTAQPDDMVVAAPGVHAAFLAVLADARCRD